MELLTIFHSKARQSDIRDKTGITGRRWAVHVDKYSIGLYHEVQFNNRSYVYGSGYYILSFTKYWKVGYEDLGWYDGPHKCFSLGFLHFIWSH